MSSFLSTTTRRRFMADVAKTAGGATLCALGLAIVAHKAKALPAAALRPPGALAEPQFLGACLRCGLCVRACPYDTLRLATLDQDVATGTPYFTARNVPCEMCEDIPCVGACPSGALDPALTDIDQARMGTAVLVDQENCLNFLGLRCDVCYRACPVIDEAITIERQHNVRSGRHALFLPTVHAEHCTGCGKCEHSCVLEAAAIRVLPARLARGSGGEHYRLGWQEKDSAGVSLVPEDPEHRYNLPEGLRYEYQGRGLVRDVPTGAGALPEKPPEPAHAEPVP